MEVENIGHLAANILSECRSLEQFSQSEGIPLPKLAAGESTKFWSEDSPELTHARTKVLGMLNRLTMLLQGPHDFFHELVATNWDHGALYAFLESNQLDYMASSGGCASLSRLSEQSGIPEDKLLRILELLRCRGILNEPEDGIFSLTAISEELLHDGDFKAWVEFQLFETRIASAHLSEALQAVPNDYANGKSAFKQGLGIEMYDWHAQHGEKGLRFRRAMKGVSRSLDPGDSLFLGWFEHVIASKHAKVVEIGGRYGFASISLAEKKPNFSFEIRSDSQEFLSCGEALVRSEVGSRLAFTHVSSLFEPCPKGGEKSVLVYVIRNLFWNWKDDDIVKLLQSLLPTLRATPETCILVTDGVSPLPKEFPPHVEVAYRRRDITTMTMHNVKQRTQIEWLQVFGRVDRALKVNTTFQNSSHVYKALWELRLEV